MTPRRITSRVAARRNMLGTGKHAAAPSAWSAPSGVAPKHLRVAS